MKKIFIFIILYSFISCLLAQNNDSISMQFTLLWQRETTGTTISADPLGNIYLANANTLYLYSAQGDILHTYTDLKYGNFYSIDSRNPMKIMVFSKDFMHLTLLNKQLSPLHSAWENMNDLNMLLPACVCSSYDNGMWIYDESSDKIIRYDNAARLTNETPLLSNILSEKFIPQLIAEKDSKLIACDSTCGFYIFNHLGTFIKSIPIQGITDFCVYNDNIIYIRDENLHIVNISTLWQQTVPLPLQGISRVRILPHAMAALHKDGRLLLYQWE